MQQNLSIPSRYSRMVAGIITLAAASGGRKRGMMSTVAASIGAMKVAEGVLGWCPLMHVADRLFQEPSQSANAQATTSSQAQNTDKGNQQHQETKQNRDRTQYQNASHSREDHQHQGTYSETWLS
ncbi:YgaP-like transmembrane domain [Alicyclobacillus tolerans]|uniref:Inner membrane protein YgaP-like transmembrane domain-containing protein n=1 Tax=Alicyclobacillus tolerans TaxID=90970 RepID=A0A1M6Q0K6_9BACL|nr:DUF2892 domain-containing protein [Alicyclobacillus montanus]SHK13714.1 Protein of unknown function [Alicyclobacillus montanus]